MDTAICGELWCVDATCSHYRGLYQSSARKPWNLGRGLRIIASFVSQLYYNIDYSVSLSWKTKLNKPCLSKRNVLILLAVERR